LIEKERNIVSFSLILKQTAEMSMI